MIKIIAPLEIRQHRVVNSKETIAKEKTKKKEKEREYFKDRRYWAGEIRAFRSSTVSRMNDTSPVRWLIIENA